MPRLIKIKNSFSDEDRDSILQKVGAADSDGLVYFVQFGRDMHFALGRTKMFWVCESDDIKTNFDCYEPRGNLERSKELGTEVFFEENSKKAGKRTKSFTTMSIKNEKVTRRFDLAFSLTDDEKRSLKYFFESYFKEEEVSMYFQMPREKIGRYLGMLREVFSKRCRTFFIKVPDSEKKEGVKKHLYQKWIRFVEFIAEISFLVAAICLIKYEIPHHTFYRDLLHSMNSFELFILVLLAVFLLLKIYIIIGAEDSIWMAGIVILVVQVATMILLTSYLSQASLMRRLVLFIILNMLLFLCFQLLSGNNFQKTFPKLCQLGADAVLVYVVISLIQTIATKFDFWSFSQKFINYLRLW